MFSGNETLYLTLLKEFVVECKDNLADIEDGLSAWDVQKAIGAAHKLKGTASNIFVTQVYEGARELELTLRKMKHLTSESLPNELIKAHKIFKALETDANEFIASVGKV